VVIQISIQIVEVQANNVILLVIAFIGLFFALLIKEVRRGTRSVAVARSYVPSAPTPSDDSDSLSLLSTAVVVDSIYIIYVFVSPHL